MRSKEKEKMLILLRDNKTLTKKERQYARLMIRGENMLFVKGATSLAKSAIAKTIAEKLGLHYIQLATPTKEPSDFGVLPMPDPSGHFLRTFKPYFAKFCTKEFLESEKKNGVLIVFEEINRCGQDVLNACLNIFGERRVEDFVFADDVLFYATGNVGIDDGTKVKQLEKAQTRRMFLKEHTLSNEEWLEGYGHNLTPLLYEYFEKHTEKSYPKTDVKGEFVNQTNYANWSKFNSAFKDHIYMLGLEDKENDTAIMLKTMIGFCKEQICDHECNVTPESTQDLLDYLENMVILSVPDLMKGEYFGKKIRVKKEVKVSFLTECLDWVYKNDDIVFSKKGIINGEKNPFEYIADFLEKNFDKDDADSIASKFLVYRNIFGDAIYSDLLRKYLESHYIRFISNDIKSRWYNNDKNAASEKFADYHESYIKKINNKDIKQVCGYDPVKYFRFLCQIEMETMMDISKTSKKSDEVAVLDKIIKSYQNIIKICEENKNG